MTLKVGEHYKARNGNTVEIVDDLKGGLFDGYARSGPEAVRIVYRADGSALYLGWAEWSIDGLTKLLFEPGVRYKTRGGLDAGIDLIRDYDRSLEGWVDFPEGRTKVCWFHTGRIGPDKFKDDMLDLMPPFVETAGGVKQKQPDGSTRFWFFVEEGDPRLAELAAKKDADDLLGRIRKLESQTYEQEQRLQGLPTGPELRDRLDGIGRRVDAVRQGLNDAVTVIGKLETQINGSDYGRKPGELDSIKRRLAAGDCAMAEMQSALARIEDCLTAENRKAADVLRQHGFEVCESVTPAGMTRNHPGSPECGNPACGQCYTPKCVIKGGWINVYRTSRGIVWDDMCWSNKASADDGTPYGERIACIQIPDFFEGEGL